MEQSHTENKMYLQRSEEEYKGGAIWNIKQYFSQKKVYIQNKQNIQSQAFK